MLSKAQGRPRSAGVREERKRQTRAALLEAAKAVLARRGLSGMTSREVAQEAGVSIGTVFLHFPSTGALVEALLDEHIEAALEKSQKDLPKEGLVRQLVHVSQGLFESYDVEPELSREYLSLTLFSKVPGGATEVRLAQFEAWVNGVVSEAVARKEIPPIEPRLAFTGYFSLYFGLLVSGLRGHLTRKQQLKLLDAGLRRLFAVEKTR